MLTIQQSTADVAQLFKRLAGIVAEQSEQVQSVEDRLDASLDALEKGEQHLENANQAAGSNTVLAMQVTAVLIAALIMFMLFAA
jgi:t-SNARE complex subunit (syntaxin)